jgi:cytochrome P450
VTPAFARRIIDIQTVWQREGIQGERILALNKVELGDKKKAHTHLHDLPVSHDGRPFIGRSKDFANNPLTFFLESYLRLGPLYHVRFSLKKSLVMAGLEVNDFVWKNSDLWDYQHEMRVFGEELDRSYLIQLDGEAHQRKRHRMMQGFKPKALTPQIPAMSSVILKEIDALPARHADLRALCTYLATAMTSQALLRFTLPDGVEAKIVALASQLIVGNSFGFFRHLWFRRPAYQRLKQELYTFIDQILNKRVARSSQEDDILSYILDAHPLDEPPLTRREIIFDIFLLLEASSEVVGHLILWALLYLSRHPEWLTELREELYAWHPEQFKNLNDWPKLKATVLEIERLRPSIPYFSLIPTRDFSYQGVWIPKGTHIIHAASVPHFLSEIYDDPFNFSPQRFLGEQSYPAKAQSNYGGGIHYCIGQPLARIQVPLAIATVIANYDLSFEVTPSLKAKRGMVITPVEPALPVQFLPRS